MPDKTEWRTKLNAKFLNLELVWKSRNYNWKNYNWTAFLQWTECLRVTFGIQIVSFSVYGNSEFKNVAWSPPLGCKKPFRLNRRHRRSGSFVPVLIFEFCSPIWGTFTKVTFQAKRIIKKGELFFPYFIFKKYYALGYEDKQTWHSYFSLFFTRY